MTHKMDIIKDTFLICWLIVFDRYLNFYFSLPFLLQVFTISLSSSLVRFLKIHLYYECLFWKYFDSSCDLSISSIWLFKMLERHWDRKNKSRGIFIKKCDLEILFFFFNIHNECRYCIENFFKRIRIQN